MRTEDLILKFNVDLSFVYDVIGPLTLIAKSFSYRNTKTLASVKNLKNIRPFANIKFFKSSIFENEKKLWFVDWINFLFIQFF